MKVGKKKSRDLLRHVGREYTRIGLDEWTEMQSEVKEVREDAIRQLP